MSISLLVLGVCLFIGLVVVHELGHFIAARRNGVKVEEFGIFFPPRLYKRLSREGWIFSINALPLGGFVRLKGEHDNDRDKGSFGVASLWVKTKIMLAGVGMNLLAALVLLSLVALIGMPRVITKAQFGENQFTIKSDTKVIKHNVLIADVLKDSPAAKGGLKAGDQLVSIGLIGSLKSVTSAAQLPSLTKSLAGQKVEVSYIRDHQTHSLQTTLLSTQEVSASQNTNMPKGYLGISSTDTIVQRSTWSAPIVAAGLSVQLTRLTFHGLWTALKGLGSTIAGFITHNKAARETGQTTASEQVSGPLGIFFILKAGASQGLGFMLFIVGLLSLTLAIMNVLPIPALDGGHLYMILFSRKVLHRPLSQVIEERFIILSYVLILIILILVTYVDFQHFIIGKL